MCWNVTALPNTDKNAATAPCALIFFAAIWLTVILWFFVLIILSQSLLRKLPAYANLDQLKTLENSPWDDSLVHAVENTAAAFLNSSEHAPLERSYLWTVKFWTEGLRR